MNNEKISWDERIEKIWEKTKAFIGDSKKKKYIEWLKEKKKVGYVFDYNLFGKCYQIVKQLEKNNDYCIVIVGNEGSGKTTLSSQLGSIIYNKFSVEHLHLLPNEFIASLRKSKSGMVQVVDEGGVALFSRESMNYVNRNMIKVFMTIRMKNLALIINIPDFKSLDSYIREHRVKLLIEILERGKYKAYFGEALANISRDISKVKKISAIRIPEGYFWHGWFSKSMGLINEKDYNEKKHKHVNKMLGDIEKSFKERDGMPQLINPHEFAEKTGMTYKGIMGMIAKGTVPALKVGSRWMIDWKKVIKPTKYNLNDGFFLDNKGLRGGNITQ